MISAQESKQSWSQATQETRSYFSNIYLQRQRKKGYVEKLHSDKKYHMIKIQTK